MAAMSIGQTLKRRWKWLLVIVPVLILSVVLGGTFIYIHFIAPDPAPRRTLSSVPSSDAGDPSQTAAGAIDGTWKATDGSKAQYRVKEVLSGQDNEATGTSTGVTGQSEISGTTVGSASFTVDMKTFSSGESQRDGQFRNRIMETSQFPTSTFELTSPVQLTAIPDNLVPITVQATGKFTLHGVTKDVTIPISAQRNGSHLEINGTLPITFSDYNIDDPSGGPASVGDNGEMEFLLVLAK
jgi:polyisoprenoid-binding protein YceI